MCYMLSYMKVMSIYSLFAFTSLITFESLLCVVSDLLAVDIGALDYTGLHITQGSLTEGHKTPIWLSQVCILVLVSAPVAL